MKIFEKELTSWEKTFYRSLKYFPSEDIIKLGNFFESLDKVMYFESDYYYDVKKNKWPATGTCVSSVNSLYFVNYWLLSHCDMWELSAKEIIDQYSKRFLGVDLNKKFDIKNGEIQYKMF